MSIKARVVKEHFMKKAGCLYGKGPDTWEGLFQAKWMIQVQAQRAG